MSFQITHFQVKKKDFKFTRTYQPSVLSLRKSLSKSGSLSHSYITSTITFLFTCSILKNSSSSFGARPPTSFFQMSGAFKIFIIKIVVFQCVISEKTELQANAYSTHCTAIKSIYMLQVNLASRSLKAFLSKSNFRSGWRLHLSVSPEGLSFNQVTYH